MEVIPILRELWRWRRVVLIAGVISLLVGLIAAFKVSPSGIESRQYSVGVGATRLLLDTPESQTVDLSPKGAEGLTIRANLLANLMASGPLRLRMARLTGIPPEQLLTIAPSTSGPVDPSLLAQSGTAKASSPEAHTVTLKADPQLPIIFVNTRAPTAAMAAKLGNSAIVALRQYLGSVAARQEVPNARQVVVTQLGAAQAAEIARGPSKLGAIVATIVVFLVLCGGIVAFAGLARGWRQAAYADVDYDEDDIMRDSEALAA